LERDPAEIRELFLNPNITEEFEVEWSEPDYDGIKSMLCHEHDFSENRVEKALNELKSALKKSRGVTSLDQWL